MEMEELTLEDIFEELDRISARPGIKRADGEFTVREYMKWKGVSYDASRSRLDKLIDEGILSKRKVFHNNRWVNAYKPIF